MERKRFNPFKGRARTWTLLGLILVAAVGLVLLGRGLIGDGSDGEGTATATPRTEQPPEGSGIRVETVGSAAAAPGGEGGQLQIRLSKGQEQQEVVVRPPLATGTPLSEEEIAAILQRLPQVTPEPGDVDDFRLPEEPIPPPRTGETIEEPFPPPEEAAPPTPPEETAEGPLEVVRFAPEGEIPLAPFLQVTFNQPMVPLATVEELAAEEVPVRLTPQVPGIWRWIGTKTLTFEYEGEGSDRFPMATEYVAEVPAGTTSAVGGALAETVTWKFSTPPPQVEQIYPSGGPQPLDPVIFISFNQRIEPAAVLGTVEMTVDGREVATRLATQQEIEADERVSRLAENAPEGRWLAFRAQETLPSASGVSIRVGPGTPSAEGPLVTDQAQTYSFQTYAPLRIEDHRCGWSEGECPPFNPFFIHFNNPLDTEAFAESMLQIEPELAGAVVRVTGSTIEIRGASKGRTTYRVTVDAALQDVFGQTLGDDETVSFRVGSARPVLSGPDRPLVTVDPSASEPVFTVYTVNYDRLQVQAYAVEPADWPAYQDYIQNYYREEDPPTPPGQQVMDETVRVEAAADALTEVGLELGDALEGDTGHLVVVVQPPSGLISRLRGSRPPMVHAWVQVTEIGVDAFVDHSEMVVWTTALADGAPLADVTVSLYPTEVTGTTDSGGTARLDLPAGGVGLVMASRGQDTAILPSNPYYWSNDGWQRRPVQDELRWYVFDDRQMYRPGEEVHVKGWVRRVGGRQDGDVSLPGDAVTGVRYIVTGPQGNELLSGNSEANALGGFDLAFTLPENTNLGYATLQLFAQGNTSGLTGTEYGHHFQIQEFRRPEFEVTARTESEGPYFVGDSATVSVSANYFAGGPLPNAEVTWNVSSTPGSYAPPNWPDFTFGKWIPWWRFGPVVEEAFYEPFGPQSGQPARVETFSGVTDAAGNHYLQIDFEAMDQPQPFTVRAEATVFDVNRQAWAANTSVLVHPAELYVGLRSERTFVERGEPLEIEAIVTDLDGEPIPGRTIEMEAARLEWRYRQGTWGEEAAETLACTVQSAAEPVTCTFETEKGGEYRITATVRDEQGRANLSQITRWVSGGERPPSRNVEQEQVTLIPDKETYQPGDVAQILVQAPFAPAEGLLTVSRSGILYTERFAIAEGSHTLSVPIEEGHVPNLNVQVDLVGAAARTDDAGNPLPEAPRRPAYATGSLNLPISLRSRTLDVSAAAREARLEPGGETTIEVTVTDAQGRPVSGAGIAVVVVDEAILALTNYQLADPLAAFYRPRSPLLNSVYGRASIILARPESLLENAAAQAVEATRVVTEMVEEGAVMAEAPMEEPAAADEAAGAAPGQPEPIRVRTDFNPLAAFAPAVRSDEQGRAQVPVQLPDNLTRYRIMVVAVGGDKQFGTGESNLTARLPLMVRPSAPRFLNFGDQFELPVVLQNQTDEEMTVDVAVQASNLALTEGAGRRVSVPANDRVEVRFPAETAEVGTARLQIAAVSGSYADAATVALPVYTPATTEAFATYGVIDEGAIVQPVQRPDGVFPQFGGLEINTSATALQALTDAVLYLVEYPYECSEQIASRMMAIAALRDVLTAFEAEGLPAPEELEATVRRDVERLQGLQNGNGGFPIWRRGEESIPFYSIHVPHALQRARDKGFDVPEETMQRSLAYLRDIESYYPHWYSQRLRQNLSAYALYVRHLMNDTDRGKAARLLDDAGLEGLSLEAVAWLWQVLGNDPAYGGQTEAIRRHIENRAVETANAANFTTSYGDDAYLMLHSNRRTDGVILDALIANAPESDLIPKVVNGLLAHRTKGRWNNTQENVFILLALDRYFNTFEAQEPEFVARIWLGETYAGGHEFVGYTTDIRSTDVPMSYLVETEEESQSLILSKEGPGRLYYRLGLRYAPDDLTLDPLDMGFVVQRSYEAIDDPGDVTRDADGRWHIKAGARVRVRLTMVARNRRYHVALVDPLPAGLEIVNPALAVSGDIPEDPSDPSRGYGWWWWGTWYQHQNMRDERAEAFTTLLWDGVYNYSYMARATTPGQYVVPPAKAEEMYSPEVFGRSGSDRVIVE